MNKILPDHIQILYMPEKFVHLRHDTVIDKYSFENGI